MTEDSPLSDLDRPVLQAAHDRHSGLRAKPLAKLVQLSLEGWALASPQPLPLGLMAPHLRALDIDSSQCFDRLLHASPHHPLLIVSIFPSYPVAILTISAKNIEITQSDKSNFRGEPADIAHALFERLLTEPERLKLAKARRDQRRQPPTKP